VKIKTVVEVREMIDNMSLNEYQEQTEEKAMIDLNTQDALLASTKLLSIQLETVTKRLEAREVAQLYAKTICDFREKAHESGACLPASLRFSKEQVKYMGNYSSKQRNLYSNTYNPGWAETSKIFLPKQQCFTTTTYLGATKPGRKSTSVVFILELSANSPFTLKT